MKTEQVGITSEQIKLEQFLKFAGVCASGGEAKVRILAQEVKVNGEVCTMRGRKIRPGDRVAMDDREWVAVAAEK